MFEKIIIANRGDQPHSGAAAQLHCVAATGSSNFAAEITHV
ncbi:MAG TPA: hypothetical protein VGO72_01055 [Herminiimonas sp.]|jgi:hypothetical protein|nr:hypothetical protein [Herminiimonas sp.]